MCKMYLQWFHWAKELKCYEKKKKKLSIKRNKHNQTLSYWEVSYLSHGLIHCKNKPDEILAIIPKPQFHLWKTSRRSNSALKVHKENPSDPLYGCRSVRCSSHTPVISGVSTAMQQFPIPFHMKSFWNSKLAVGVLEVLFFPFQIKASSGTLFWLTVLRKVSMEKVQKAILEFWDHMWQERHRPV